MDVRCCCGQPGSDQTQGPALAETPESPRPTEGVRAKDGCSPLLTRLELLMACSGVTVFPREPQPSLAWGRCSSAGGMREVSLGPSVWDSGLESRCGRQPEVGRGSAASPCLRHVRRRGLARHPGVRGDLRAGRCGSQGPSDAPPGTLQAAVCLRRGSLKEPRIGCGADLCLDVGSATSDLEFWRS